MASPGDALRDQFKSRHFPHHFSIWPPFLKLRTVISERYTRLFVEVSTQQQLWRVLLSGSGKMLLEVVDIRLNRGEHARHGPGVDCSES